VPQPRQTGGFHHDLKPPNILAFNDPETGRPIFKITDFGTAKLDFVLASKSRSHATYETQQFAGDSIYGAPDYSQQKRAGRKADIWSLGCCFLEILLWNFGYGGEKLESFRFERFKEPAGNTGATSSFWYFDVTSKKVALKPAVKEKLEELQRICYGRGQFQNLVHEIELMLTLKPNERKSAATVRSAFKAMHQEVEVNLDQDPDFYKKVPPTTTPMFAPVPESFITPSRIATIDDRMVAAPYGRPSFPLPVSASDHQRSCSDPSSFIPNLQIDPHPSDTAQSGAHLMTPDGDQLPRNSRPGTPSIEISDYSALGPRGRAIIGGLYGTPTRDEIPTLRRKGSGSTNSATM
jgi:serine/threonine protein kinase